MMFGGNHTASPDETLGGRVSLARDAKALSMEDAAQRLGVLASSWRAWECDRDVPRANRLTTMAGILGVSPIWLMTGQGQGPLKQERSSETTELQQAMRRFSRDFEALNERMRGIARSLAAETDPGRKASADYTR